MIAVLGASGNIGSHVVQFLQKKKNQRLRLGCRGLSKLSSLSGIKGIERMAVDCQQLDELSAFVGGSSLVVNCVGPSHELTEKVIDLCEVQGIHCVDLGSIKGESFGKTQGSCSIHSAGMSQGLSGILQRVILHGLEQVERLEYSFGGVSAYTASAAEDFLHGINEGDYRAMIRYEEGKLIPCGMSSLDHGGFYHESVNFYPFYDEESSYITSHYPLKEGVWCFSPEGTEFNQFIKKARFAATQNKQEAISDMLRLSRRDEEIHGPKIKFFLRATWSLGGKSMIRELTFESKEQGYLSALVATQIIQHILEKQTSIGRYPLVALDNPIDFYEKLSQDKGIKTSILEFSEEELQYGTL